MKLPPLLDKPHLPQTSLLGRLGLALTSVLAIVAGFALASLLFTVLLITGLVAGGWLWWRLRSWARQARAAAPVIIEGEYRIVAEHPALTESRPPSRAP